MACGASQTPCPVRTLGSASDKEWQRHLFEGSWAGINWPAEYGRLGLSGREQMIWYEELARAEAPHYINTTYVGLMHAGPTLILNGSEAQRKTHLPQILSGRELWCQGFSNPMLAPILRR